MHALLLALALAPSAPQQPGLYSPQQLQQEARAISSPPPAAMFVEHPKGGGDVAVSKENVGWIGPYHPSSGEVSLSNKVSLETAVRKSDDATLSEGAQRPRLRAGMPIRGDDSPAARALGLDIHNPYPTDASIQLMKRAGIVWLRVDCPGTWRTMEPSPGAYNFTEYAAVITRLRAHGFEIVTGVNQVSPAWLPANDAAHPDGMQNTTRQVAFARLMAALAKRFEDDRILWELDNEPNLDPEWTAGNATAFGIYIHTVCAAMHAAAPDSLCVGPSNAFISRGYATWNWLQLYFETGVLNEIDGILVHPYRADAPETAVDDFKTLRNLLAEYSTYNQALSLLSCPNNRCCVAAPVGRTIPVYSGEWGYADLSASTPLITVEMQAKLVSRLSLVSMFVTDGMSIYYEWQDNNAGSDGEFMGLLFRNSSIKPSYTATKTLSGVLGNTSLVGRRKTWQDGFTTSDEWVLEFTTLEVRDVRSTHVATLQLTCSCALVCRAGPLCLPCGHYRAFRTSHVCLPSRVAGASWTTWGSPSRRSAETNQVGSGWAAGFM
jgi:hypothetical protein